VRLRSLVAATMLALAALASPAAADTVPLTVTVQGNGTVTSVESGTPTIRCPDRCTADIGKGATVTLRAKGDAAWDFGHWSDSCTPVKGDEKECTITLTSADSVSAQFVPHANIGWWAAEIAAALGLLLLTIIAWAVMDAVRPLNQRPRGGIVNGFDNRWSTSKLSVLLWTYAVLFAFIVLLIQFGTRVFPTTLQPQYLVLLGIPGASAIAAKGITSSQLSGGSTKTSLPTPTNKPLVGLGHIFSDDTGQVDLLDSQYFVFNFLLLVFFLTAFTGIHFITTDTSLPDLPASLLAVSGVGAAAYLGKKALQGSAPGSINIQPGSTAVLGVASTVQVPQGGKIKLDVAGDVKVDAGTKVSPDDDITATLEGGSTLGVPNGVAVTGVPVGTIVHFPTGGSAAFPAGTAVAASPLATPTPAAGAVTDDVYAVPAGDRIVLQAASPLTVKTGTGELDLPVGSSVGVGPGALSLPIGATLVPLNAGGIASSIAFQRKTSFVQDGSVKTGSRYDGTEAMVTRAAVDATLTGTFTLTVGSGDEAVPKNDDHPVDVDSTLSLTAGTTLTFSKPAVATVPAGATVIVPDTVSDPAVAAPVPPTT
jgi:hypothetical protein